MLRMLLMSIQMKASFLKRRHGYSDKDLADYAADDNMCLAIGIDKLFRHHVEMEQKQQSMFDRAELDTVSNPDTGELF